MALVIYDSSGANVFEGNAFVGNLTPLSLSGKRTDTRFDRNYWSDHGDPDLDGDGISDRPYRLSNVFDHLRGNLTAADLFSRSVAASALGAAERTFPVLDPVPVVDAHPLARPPVLARGAGGGGGRGHARSVASAGPAPSSPPRRRRVARGGRSIVGRARTPSPRRWRSTERVMIGYRAFTKRLRRPQRG